VTPFDVIKTRIQTQSTTQEPLFQPSSSNPPSITCCQPSTIAEKSGVLCQHDPRLDVKSGAASSSSNALNRVSAFNQDLNRSRLIRLTPQMGNGMSAIACDFPDKSVAARELEMARSSGRMAGLWDGVVKVGRAEGVRGLWRGLTPTL
jgi:hypothetical protein